MTEPIGMKPNHRHFTCWNHGNGLFRYEPNLTNDSTDFEDGYHSVSNLAAGDTGITIQEDGDAEVIFEVFTPYIIVGKVNDLDDLEDDAEASVVTIENVLPVELSISLDHGHTWRSAGHFDPSEESSIDLTPFVNGTYGYLLKLETSGDEGALAIRSLRIDTWVQIAPISLPRLKEGTNHLRYEIGDRYSKQTVPLLITPNAAEPDDFAKYAVEMPEHYQPQKHTARIQEDVTLRLSAPEGKKIAWFSVGATFRTHQGKYAVNTNNRIAYAIEEPSGFREIHKAAVPEWTSHWRYNWDSDVILDEPAKKVYVRFTGDPAVNVMRACLHLLHDRAVHKTIHVEHAYRIGDEVIKKNFNFEESQEYIIRCEGEPENEYIRMSAPSDGS